MIRDLNGVAIRQNHKTSFFNANDLLELYNQSNQKKVEMTDYLRSKQFKEFKQEVLKDILQNTQNLQDNIRATIKEGGDLTDLFVAKDSEIMYVKRGKNGGTWLHPYLFMDFAMWLSPSFKLTCIKWIYDKLIQVRDEAGESFKEVNDALFDLKPNRARWDYINEAQMINKLVFNSSDRGQRNSATEQELTLLKNLQKADIKLIQNGLDYYERYEKLKELKQYF